MKHLHSPWFLLGALPVFGAILLSYVIAQLYWGHGFRPPSPDLVVRDFQSLERFSTVWWPAKHREGRPGLFSSARGLNWTAGEYPLGRFPSALLDHHLTPSSSLEVPSDLQAAAIVCLDRAGLVFSGEPGYNYAKQLHGHFALGRGRDGNLLLAVALAGGEVSNDHYPYYEALFSVAPNSALTLLRSRHYWYDVAGLEGCAHILPSAFLLVLVSAAWSVVGLVNLGCRTIAYFTGLGRATRTR